MKKILLFLLFVSPLYGADIVQYDVNSGWCKAYLKSADEIDYVGKVGYMVFTDQTPQTVVQLRSLLSTIPVNNLKIVGGQAIEMNANEKKSVKDLEEYDNKVSEKNAITSFYKNDVYTKAIVKILAEIKGVSKKDVEDQINSIISHELKLQE